MDIKDFLLLKDFNDFKNIGNRLIDINDLPQWFWNKNNIPLNYNLLPDYCKLVNERRMRCVEITFDNDIVICLFKVIQIIKTKQIKMFELPMSLNNDVNNINIVINHFNNCLHEQFVLLSNIYQTNDIDAENCNYYYNCDYWKERVTNKYRRQHRFSRYEKDFKLFVFNNLDEQLKNEFINIYNLWKPLKQKAYGTQKFLNALNVKGQNYIYYIGSVNNVNCICGIGIITKYGLYIIFEYSLDRVDRFYDTIVIYTSYILSQYLYKYYSIYNIYKLGARKSNKGLINFKKRTSIDKVISYKLNVNQLLESYKV